MSLWSWLTGRSRNRDEIIDRIPELRVPSEAPATGSRSPAPAGDLLQFPVRTNRTIDLVVGLDFGTSSVKAAIRSPYMLGGRITVVDFGELGHRSCAWLLPVAIFQESDGSLALRPSARSTESRYHLKLPLLSWGPSNSALMPDGDAAAWAAAFLALALREVRGRFLATQKATYGGSAIRWSLNLGIPSAGYDDLPVRARFERLATAAWLLSKSPKPLTVAAAQSALGGAEEADIEIAVIPEVAAEVVSYARSRQRRNGLHLMLDMGASTLDLCAVSLHGTKADDTYSLLTADVQPLGLVDLHWRRMKAGGHRPPFHELPPDLAAPLPQWLASELPPELIQGFHRCDQEFVDECARTVIFRTLADLRRFRDPNSLVWKNGIPLFILGGGAAAPIVRDILRSVEARAAKVWTGNTRFLRWNVPVDDLRSTGAVPSAAEAQRLLVACGLSYLEFELGTIQRPGDIRDVPRTVTTREWTRAFVDKSQV